MKKVVIYSTEDCAACHTLTGWLDKIEVPYTKKVTDTNPEFMMEFMEVNDGEIGVPFTVISDEDDESVIKILGYDQAKFKQALGIA